MDRIALVLAETRVAEACLVDPASDPHPGVTGKTIVCISAHIACLNRPFQPRFDFGEVEAARTGGCITPEPSRARRRQVVLVLGSEDVTCLLGQLVQLVRTTRLQLPRGARVSSFRSTHHGHRAAGVADWLRDVTASSYGARRALPTAIDDLPPGNHEPIQGVNLWLAP